MAKRVTTTVGQSDFWDNDDLESPNRQKAKNEYNIPRQ